MIAYVLQKYSENFVFPLSMIFAVILLFSEKVAYFLTAFTVISVYNRQFSHVAKSRIFKNLNLKPII